MERRKVRNLVAAVPAVCIGEQCSQLRGSMFHAHSPVKTAALQAIPRPLDKLGIADPLLGLGNRPPAYAI